MRGVTGHDATVGDTGSEDRLPAALLRVREAFAGYPRRAVLDGCPHCRGRVPVDEHDLFSLAISLGGTVGTDDDLKSLLPLLLERLITTDELDETVVFGKLTMVGGWRGWPVGERDAIQSYLDATWHHLLTRYPPNLGSLRDATAFLTAVRPLHAHLERYLRTWDDTHGPAPDRHLADLVLGWVHGADPPAEAVAWAHRPTVRQRLFAAFARDADAPWAGDLAQAHDFLAPPPPGDPGER
jgi:hypothetical protein